jgi:uncharacterized membrane protein
VAERGGKIRAFVMILSLCMVCITRLTPAGLKQQATEERESEWAKTGVESYVISLY